MYGNWIVRGDVNVPELLWLAWSICHRSPDPPRIGSEIVQEAPLSNQYPVGEVEITWLADEPRNTVVRVGADGDPPPVTEYDRVWSSW